MRKKEIEKQILELFQTKGEKQATREIMKLKSPDAPKAQIKIIRHVLSRLHVKNDGTYFLKDAL